MLYLQISNFLLIFVSILHHLHSSRRYIGRFFKRFLYSDFFLQDDFRILIVTSYFCSGVKRVEMPYFGHFNFWLLF